MERPDVAHLASLARLRLGPGEHAGLAAELARMLAFFERLQELDTAGVEPATHPLALEVAEREDAPGACLPREAALGNAPDQAEGCFRVPGVLDQD